MSIVLVWFFLMGNNIIGPFQTKEMCNVIREDKPARYYHTSQCWQGPMVVVR